MDMYSARRCTSSGSDSSAINEDARFTGRMHALSASHQAALDELNYLCRVNNMYWTSGKTEGKRIASSNDDVTLLYDVAHVDQAELPRYLRARGYVPQAAFKQYSATVAWRRKLQLDDMYRNAEISHFEAIRRLMPQWTGRRSRQGVPVFVYSVSKTRPADLLATSKKDPSLSSVFLPAEYSTQFVQPLCARMHIDRVMPCSVFIIDLSGVGVQHFWNLRAHLQRASTMATLHYPESVDKIFVLGAPSFFPTIWGYINKWFEPNLTSKISVLPTSEMRAVLTKHIDVEDLPILYGGNLDWEYGMYPNLDEEAMGIVGQLANEWVEGPLRYVPKKDGDEIIAAGTEGKGVRCRVLAQLPESLPMSDSEEDYGLN